MKAELAGLLRRHLDFKWMNEDRETWRKIENDPDTCVWVDYTYYMVAYQNAYFLDRYDELTDLSFVIYNGGRAAGIWPLCVYKDKQGYQIGSWGGGTFAAFAAGEWKYSRDQEKTAEKVHSCSRGNM